jgi:hypothetical protein
MPGHRQEGEGIEKEDIYCTVKGNWYSSRPLGEKPSEMGSLVTQ